MNATAAVCFSPLCAYPLPAGGDAWEKIGVEELDLGRVGQQMKLVYPSGPERGGKYGEGVPRTGHVESPLADKPRHRSSGGGLWFVVYGDATVSPFSLLGMACEKSLGEYSSSSSTKPVGPQYQNDLLIIADPALPPCGFGLVGITFPTPLFFFFQRTPPSPPRESHDKVWGNGIISLENPPGGSCENRRETDDGTRFVELLLGTRHVGSINPRPPPPLRGGRFPWKLHTPSGCQTAGMMPAVDARQQQKPAAAGTVVGAAGPMWTSRCRPAPPRPGCRWEVTRNMGGEARWLGRAKIRMS